MSPSQEHGASRSGQLGAPYLRAANSIVELGEELVHGLSLGAEVLWDSCRAIHPPKDSSSQDMTAG